MVKALATFILCVAFFAMTTSPTHACGTGQVFLVNAVVATRDNTLTDQKDSAAAVPSSAYIIVSLQGLLGNGYLEGPFAASVGHKRAFSATNDFIFDRSNDGF